MMHAKGFPLKLLVISSVGTGCSFQGREIAQLATLACQYNQVERPDITLLQPTQAAALKVRTRDLQFLKWQQEQQDSNTNGLEHMGKAMGEAMVQGMKPAVQAMIQARARHTTCTLSDIQIDGDSASITATQKSLVPANNSNVFSILGELSKQPTPEDQIEAAEKLLENSGQTNTQEVQLKFAREGGIWTLNYGLLEKELARLDQRISDLESQLSLLERQRQLLKQFEVKTARFYKRTEYYITKPVIEMTVLNGTGHAISRVYFEGKILSPNRSVPWLSEKFSYAIAGGLEPGEQRHWALEPNMFSAWGKVEPDRDAYFEILPIRVDDAKGDKLFTVEEDTALNTELDATKTARRSLWNLLEATRPASSNSAP